MTAPVPSTLVVVDTDVFSDVYVRPREASERSDLVKQLAGKLVVIATQTCAEVLVGARRAGWGARRVAALEAILRATRVIGVSAPVVDAYVSLTVRCWEIGYALGQKVHTADRWIAATAVAMDRPLFSRDGVFHETPGLQRLEP